MPTVIDGRPHLDTEETAEAIGVSTRTLKRWRSGPGIVGPQPVVVRRGLRTLIYYALADVRAWGQQEATIELHRPRKECA